MSAWMTGIGLGLQAAQMEQSRNQQAQELAFRQQQAGINNAQEDRRFDAAQAADVRNFQALQADRAFRQQQAGINNAQEDRRFDAAQTADVRDFNALQADRAFRQKQAEQQYQMQRDEIARDLTTRKANAAIFGAASTPNTPAVPGGTGPAPQHPLGAITDDIMMNASPEALRALVAAKQNNAAYSQRMMMERNKVEMSRADGSIKNVSPEQADTWRSYGWYDDGTIMPDEFPLSLKQQQQERQDKIASFLATERDQNGEFVSNPQVFEHYRNVPFDIADYAFKRKLMHDDAMQLAQVRAQGALDVAGVRAQAKGAAGPTFSQRMQTARFNVGQAEKEYRSLTGQAGKMGNLAEPSKAVTKSAEDFSGGTGHWFKTDATQERHVRMVAAWEKYQQALAEYDQAATETYNPQQRGLLDGPSGSSGEQLPDEQATIDALSAQGLTVDQIEAKMREMGYQ